jgi:hypothetical protein
MAADRVETVIRGLPLWLLRDYLVQLGARPDADGTLRGPGWSASLAQAEDFAIGSLRVGQVSLRLEGAPEAVAAAQAALQPKLLRAGG